MNNSTNVARSQRFLLPLLLPVSVLISIANLSLRTRDRWHQRKDKSLKSQLCFDRQEIKGVNNKGWVLIGFTSYLEVACVQWQPAEKGWDCTTRIFCAFPWLSLYGESQGELFHLDGMIYVFSTGWSLLMFLFIYLLLSGRSSDAVQHRCKGLLLLLSVSSLLYFKPCCQKYLQMW